MCVFVYLYYKKHMLKDKQLIKTLLSESLVYDLIEEVIQEDYPTSFNMEEFKKLTSFKSRVEYCNEHLTRLSMGSSRRVYLIDKERVLKLAYNRKGLAQNEVEAEYSNYHDLSDIVARVFSYDEKDRWIESELARKVTLENFKRVVGISFPKFTDMLDYNYRQLDISRLQRPINWYSFSQEEFDESWENEFMYDMYNFIASYNIPVGDLKKINSYGLVTRNGTDSIILIDYGLTHEVYDSYYS